MSAQDEVRNASTKFYAALNSMTGGDAAPMSAAWSHGDDVTAMHPIGGEQQGWAAIHDSFAQVASLAASGHVELRDQIIHAGTDLAYELGYEHGTIKLAGESVDIHHRVTNIYRRENGEWKIVHHHTDISPAMLGILERLQAA